MKRNRKKFRAVQKNFTGQRRTFMFFLVAAVAGVACYSQIRNHRVDEAVFTVTRAAHGQASQVETFIAETADGKTYEIPVEVQAEEYSKEECFRLLEQAKEAFEAEFLEQNAAPEQVQTDLYLPNSWLGGRVEADYVSSQPQILDSDGTVYADDLEEAQVVNLKVTFACQDQQLEYETWIHVVPKEYKGEEKIRQNIIHAVREQEALTRQTGTFELPGRVDGLGITWSGEPDRSLWYLFFLGAAVMICLRIQKQQKEKKKRVVYQKRLLLEYPQMVMQLSLLMGAGMTPLAAWERMIKHTLKEQGSERKESSKKCFIQEMTITYREIRDGCPEAAAYEKFGQRIGLLPYQKLASLLVQYLKKGTRDIRGLLEQEALTVQEERIHAAQKVGEEAGTKLLMPMLLLLLVVLVVVLYPAIISF